MMQTYDNLTASDLILLIQLLNGLNGSKIISTLDTHSSKL